MTLFKELHNMTIGERLRDLTTDEEDVVHSHLMMPK